MILRAPKSEGGKNYLARFSKFTNEKPKIGFFPEYYDELLSDDSKFDYFDNSKMQWFCIDTIEELDDSIVDCLVISKTKKGVNEVIKKTRTAVLFIENTEEIRF